MTTRATPMTDQEIDTLDGDSLTAAVAEALGWYAPADTGPLRGWWKASTGQWIAPSGWSPATSISDAWALLGRSDWAMSQIDGLLHIIARGQKDLWATFAFGPRSDAPALICKLFLKVKERRA